jgi:DNA-binding Lrp family transcriptional regulator
MDTTDKNLLNEIQSDFPITPSPFLELGKRINITEKEVINRITRLKEEGIIRRIGGNFN